MRKAKLIAAALLLASTLIALPGLSPARAQSIDKQIESVQREIDDYRAQSKRLTAKAAGIEKELADLASQKKIIEGQIALSQLKYVDLQQQIVRNQQKIDENRDALGIILADMYINDNRSPLEMLASSRSLAQYLDMHSYRLAMSEEMTRTVRQINELMSALEVQQKETKRLLGEQKLAKRALADKEKESQRLLEHTKGDSAAYRAMTKEREKKKAELHRQQQAAIEAAMNRGGPGYAATAIGDSSKGGYPWEAGCIVNENAWSIGGPNGNGTDPLGYGCRQCVSYTAFKVGQKTGNYPYYWGNANMWPASARASGYRTGTTPRANSVAVIMSGVFGHTAWVDSVNADGSLTISQYNYLDAGGPGWGHYSKMRVSPATYDVFIYF